MTLVIALVVFFVGSLLGLSYLIYRAINSTN